MEPTATPAPVKPLVGQLRLAQSIKDPRLRDDALLKVVRQAIIHEDYWTATDVATTTSTTGKQARGLYFVVKCAIEDRQYRLAEEAANRIKAANYHDKAKAEILEARGLGASGLGSSRSEQTNRELMACMASFPKQ